MSILLMKNQLQQGLTPLRIKLSTWSFALALCALPAPAAETVPGITEPFNDVTVSASVPGTLVKTIPKEGEFIEEGRPIMEFEKQQEVLEVQRRKLLWEGKAELNAAAAQMELLKVDLEGTKRLFETTKGVSKEQVLKKELEYKQALAEFDKQTLAERREEIEYQMAIEALRKREITSPLSGYIHELFRKVGEDCKAQEPLVRIVDTRRCYFIANLEAKTAAGLQLGQSLKMDIHNGKELVAFNGAISYIAPVIDPASGLLKIRVLFDNPEGKIRPGVAGVLHLP